MASIRKAPSASPIQQKNAASPSPLKPLPTQGGAKKSNEINTKPLLSRARQYVLFFFGVLSFWLYNLSIIDRFPQSVRFFVQVFPLWFAVAIGAMTLGNIGWHMVNFGDCPDAHRELQRQIAEAKADLSKKGFKF